MLCFIETCKLENVQDRNAVVHVHQFINVYLILYTAVCTALTPILDTPSLGLPVLASVRVVSFLCHVDERDCRAGQQG